jgi:hypothetical protein
MLILDCDLDKQIMRSTHSYTSLQQLWQSLMTYWLNAYGEVFKNAPKMTEEWYNMFWKPWINWMAQQ